VCSIREVISLGILKITPPELETGGLFKKWKRCDVHKKILSSPEKFGAVERKKLKKKKTEEKNIAR